MCILEQHSVYNLMSSLYLLKSMNDHANRVICNPLDMSPVYHKGKQQDKLNPNVHKGRASFSRSVEKDARKMDVTM